MRYFVVVDTTALTDVVFDMFCETEFLVALCQNFHDAVTATTTLTNITTMDYQNGRLVTCNDQGGIRNL